MKKILHQILITFSFCASISAQQDTFSLATDALWVEDLKDDESAFSNQKIVSASRSLQDLKDLPFTIYVITKEEIQAKGYNTLVDALKWIPGIRVSQPGSGLEGETFMMRGLQGNTYAKILINDIPVKPYATRGMPIGAQLPIREAERIEVIFG
ncbi:MAG: outer membrane receptor for ferrienterochelin and colicin, partial [Saprospiraceae bacterium]